MFVVEYSELESFVLGIYCTAINRKCRQEGSGTGATQSYWHREAILAAEGDWRFFETRSWKEQSLVIAGELARVYG